jgi:CHAD domain-containing protein/CYTH domain-containing protein
MAPNAKYPKIAGDQPALSAPAPQVARQLCLRLLDAADRAAEHITSPDERGVTARHDLRVALRRLRVTLDAYEPHLTDTVSSKFARRIQQVARRTGAQRDRDVHAELLASLDLPKRRGASARVTPGRHAPDDVRANPDDAGIQRRWSRISKELRAALAEWTERHRIDGSAPRVPFGVAAGEALERSADRCMRRFARVHSADDIRGLHSARIAIKGLRYVLQPTVSAAPDGAPFLHELREAQRLLGDLHDAATLRELLRHAETTADTNALPQRSRAKAPRSAERELTRRIQAAYDALLSWRDASESARHVARVCAIAASLRSSAAPPMEIERKWLLSALPPRVRGLTPAVLRQGYLPGDALVERIRSVTHRGRTRWIRTVKTGRGIARVEIEESATTALGKALFALTEGRRVEKQRYAVDDGALTWEIDDFTDRTLVLAEVELRHETDDVPIPVWLAPYIVREVTTESDFTNWKLAR